MPIHEEPTAHLANSLKVHVMVARNVRICQGDDRKPLSSHNNLVLLTHGVCDTKPKHRHFTTDTHTTECILSPPEDVFFLHFNPLQDFVIDSEVSCHLTS